MVDENDDLDIDFQITAPDQDDGKIDYDNDDVTYFRYISPPPDNPANSFIRVISISKK